jgi:hypothetical protein
MAASPVLLKSNKKALGVDSLSACGSAGLMSATSSS